MKSFLGKFFLALIFFAAVGLYIYFNLPEIEKTFDTTIDAMTYKMLFAVIFGLGAYAIVVTNFRRIFSLFGIEKGFFEMLKLDISSLATSVILPSFGISGSLVFVNDAAQKGYSKAKALAAALLYMLTDYLAITTLLLVSFLIFWYTGFLRPQLYIPMLIFIFATGFAFYLIFMGSAKNCRSRKIIVSLLSLISKIIKKIFKKKQIDPKRVAEKLLNEFSLIARTVKKDPTHYTRALVFAVVLHLFRATALFLVFLALGFSIPLHILLSGYVVGMVLVVISPTPNGIGFVEGGMLFVFVSLGVSAGVAGTATIIYRGFQFWIPFFTGLFFIQHKNLKNLKEEAVHLGDEFSNGGKNGHR